MAASRRAPATVDTVIAAERREGDGRGRRHRPDGTAPFTAKLEKDKAYKARVTAPGFVAQGARRARAARTRSPRSSSRSRDVISVTSTPPGAMIYVDGVDDRQVDAVRRRAHRVAGGAAARPRDAAQGRLRDARAGDHVLGVHRGGRAPHRQRRREAAGQRAAAHVRWIVRAPLERHRQRHRQRGLGEPSGSGDAGSASGSAATQPEGGATSPDTGATKPDTGTTKPDTGAGSAAAKPSGGEAGSGAAATGSADPSPSWAH